MDSTRDYYLEHVSDLADLFDQYLVHNDVMVGHHCGPQKGAKCYDPNEEPYFGFEVEDHTITWETEGRQKERVLFECHREKVHVIYLFDDAKYREDHYMTHENCLKYLAQLPRGWHAFTTKEDYKP